MKSVCEIVKAYAGQVGLKPADFGAHSLRAGLLTSAARRGASVFKMRDVSRHKPMALINLVYRDQLFPHRAYARAFEALLRFTPWGSAAAELSFDLLGRPAAIAWRTRGGGHPGTIFTAARFHCQWDEPVLPTIHHRRSSADYWDAGRRGHQSRLLQEALTGRRRSGRWFDQALAVYRWRYLRRPPAR